MWSWTTKKLPVALYYALYLLNGFVSTERKGSRWPHYSDVIMSAMASQITGVSIVCSTVCSGAGQRKHQSSASLAFVRGIHRWPVVSLHKGSVTQKFHFITSSWRQKLEVRYTHSDTKRIYNRFIKRWSVTRTLPSLKYQVSSIIVSIIHRNQLSRLQMRYLRPSDINRADSKICAQPMRDGITL